MSRIGFPTDERPSDWALQAFLRTAKWYAFLAGTGVVLSVVAGFWLGFGQDSILVGGVAVGVLTVVFFKRML
jgi:hypothetical protein